MTLSWDQRQRELAVRYQPQRSPNARGLPNQDQKSSPPSRLPLPVQRSGAQTTLPSLLQRRHDSSRFSEISYIESLTKLPLLSPELHHNSTFPDQGMTNSAALSVVSPLPRPPSLRRVESTPLLTPPEETVVFHWNSMLSPSTSLPNRVPESIPTVSSNPSSNPCGLSSGHSISSQGLTCPSGQTGQDSLGDFSGQRGESGHWLDRAVEITVELIDPADTLPNRVEILSQTLPNPAPADSRPKPLFVDIISAVQSRYGQSRSPYITIFHAVPSKFELPDLPTSPPSTPNLSSGHGDYFSQTIFAHAAVVPSYHALNSHLGAPVPASPNTTVAPASVHFSVLERLIPPSTVQEGRQLFSPSGRSALIDRMAELSPDNGTLLFVYPTRAGATTFQNQYLSPVVDPVLRYIVELHGLSYEVAEELGSLNAIREMSSLEQLKAKMLTLCHGMNQLTTTPNLPNTRFSLVSAHTGTVSMASKTWTGWYLKQEHQRCKSALQDYWGRGKRLSAQEGASAGSVLREFIDGVQKAAAKNDELGAAVEVAAFVIRRTDVVG